MKKILMLLLAPSLGAYAQDVDTLSNHADGLSLECGQYLHAGEWGFYAGHNSFGQQQFGEKYLVEGHVHVLGVVAHMKTSTGTVSDPDGAFALRVWPVDGDGKPRGTAAAMSVELAHADLVLDGPTIALFPQEAHMDDAFFVTLDLDDYAHEGLAGDTLGLYYAPDGSRSAADIANTPYRNVFQPHSHGAPTWKDFYAQATTPDPIATHLALYPIVELDDHTSVGQIAKGGLKLSALYPNPASNALSLSYWLETNQKVGFSVLDMQGRLIESIDPVSMAPGEHQRSIDISGLPQGVYLLCVRSENAQFALRFVKKNLDR